MRKLGRLALTGLAGGAMFGFPLRAMPLSAAEAPALGPMRTGIALATERLAQTLQSNPRRSYETRDLAAAALDALSLSHDFPLAETFLRRALADQNMDPSALDYGALPALSPPGKRADPNALEYAALACGPLLLGENTPLPPAFRDWLKPHVLASLAALRRHTVSVGNTGLCLTNAVDLILLGEAAGDSAAREEGSRRFDSWLLFTRRNGIREYDSPVFYGADLDALNLGYLYAAWPGAKEKFKAALDFFWADIAANYFPGQAGLSGPQSRESPLPRAGGVLGAYLAREGIAPAAPAGRADLRQTFVVASSRPNGYHPDPAILAWARTPEKTVISHWDGRAGGDRYNYVTPDFALGSASADYGPQDRSFSLELAFPNAQPALALLPDIDPMRPGHPLLHPLTVQDQGTLLLMSDLDPSRAGKVTRLAVNLQLPAQADAIVVDGRSVAAATAPQELSDVPNSVIGLRQGQAGIAIRVFQSPPAVLKSEPDSRKSGVIIVAFDCYQGPAQMLTQTHARIGLLVMAAHCADESAFQDLLKRAADAQIDQSEAADQWLVSAQVEGHTLTAGWDMAAREILYRRVDGRDWQAAPLTVNGQDMTRLLPDLPTPAAPPQTLPPAPAAPASPKG